MCHDNSGWCDLGDVLQPPRHWNSGYLREATRTPISRRRITLKILEGEGGTDCTD